MSFAHSEKLSRGAFLQPPPNIGEVRGDKKKKEKEDSASQSPLKHRRRRANLYDAVAGRVTSRGFVHMAPSASKYRDTASASSGARIRGPEELLLRKDHPLRQVENGEPYFAHDKLRDDCPLPNSDLLQSIHAYASDFYKYTLGEKARKSHYSMNESALLAMGILVEEMAKDGLGENGDLTMIEPQGQKGEISGNPADYIVKRGRPVGWRANIDGKKTKTPRRNRSRSGVQPKPKRPRLEELMAANRRNQGKT